MSLQTMSWIFLQVVLSNLEKKLFLEVFSYILLSNMSGFKTGLNNTNQKLPAS